MSGWKASTSTNDELLRVVQPFDIGAPAKLGPGTQKRGCSGRQAKAHGLAQLQPPRETENDPRQHAVACTDCAFRLDRDRSEALAFLRGHQQRTLRAKRQHDDLTAALLDYFARGFFLLKRAADFSSY